jgi:hypothetical protein
MVGNGCVSLLHSVQIGPGVHPASYPQSITGYFLRGKVTEADLHLVPRSGMVELYFHSLVRLHGIMLN